MMGGMSFLTAFDLQRACLCVQREAAQVHVAHSRYCDPNWEKKLQVIAFYTASFAYSDFYWMKRNV